MSSASASSNLRKSHRSAQNDNFITEPVPWQQSNANYAVPSFRESSPSSRGSNVASGGGVARPTSKKHRPASKTSPAQDTLEMPGLRFDSVGSSESLGQMPKQRWPTRFDRSPRLSPRERPENPNPAPGLRGIDTAQTVPPTSWKQQEVSQTSPSDQNASVSSPTSSEGGYFISKLSGSAADLNSINSCSSETLPEPPTPKKSAFNFQFEDSRTLDALVGAEQEKSHEQNPSAMGVNQPANGPVYQDMGPTSPYFRDFDYDPSDQETFSTALKYMQENESNPEHVPTRRKSLRFEYQNASGASSSTRTALPVDTDAQGDEPTTMNEILNIPSKSTDRLVMELSQQPGKLIRSASDTSLLAAKKDAITGSPTDADARRNLPSQRNFTRSSSVEQRNLSPSPEEEEEEPLELEKAKQPARVSFNVPTQATSPSDNKTVDFGSRTIFQESRRHTFSTPNPPQLKNGSRQVAATTLFRDHSNSSILGLQSQPRHPLAHSELPPRSPSPVQNPLFSPAFAQPPETESRFRKRLRKKKRGSSAAESDADVSADEHFKTVAYVNTSATQRMSMDSKQSRRQSNESRMSHRTDSALSTNDDTKIDPKFRQFANAVANYYKPSQSGEAKPKAKTKDRSRPPAAAANFKLPKSESKPRRRSFGSIFGGSSKGSDTEKETKRGDRASFTSTRSNVSFTSSTNSIAPASTFASRDASPVRSDFRSDSGTTSGFLPVQSDSGKNDSAQSIIKTDSPLSSPTLPSEPAPKVPVSAPTQTAVPVKSMHSLGPSPIIESSTTISNGRNKQAGNPTSAESAMRIESTELLPPVPTIPAAHRIASPTPSSAASISASSVSSQPSYFKGPYKASGDVQSISTADLAAFNNAGSEILMFRRFDAVHKRILLEMQDRIVNLESDFTQVENLVKELKEKAEKRQIPAIDYNNARARRLELLNSLKNALNDYDDLLLKFNSLRIPPSEQKNAVDKFKKWIGKNGSTTSDAANAFAPPVAPFAGPPASMTPPSSSSSAASIPAMSHQIPAPSQAAPVLSTQSLQSTRSSNFSTTTSSTSTSTITANNGRLTSTLTNVPTGSTSQSTSTTITPTTITRNTSSSVVASSTSNRSFTSPIPLPVSSYAAAFSPPSSPAPMAAQSPSSYAAAFIPRQPSPATMSASSLVSTLKQTPQVPPKQQPQVQPPKQPPQPHPPKQPQLQKQPQPQPQPQPYQRSRVPSQQSSIGRSPYRQNLPRSSTSPAVPEASAEKLRALAQQYYPDHPIPKPPRKPWENSSPASSRASSTMSIESVNPHIRDQAAAIMSGASMSGGNLSGVTTPITGPNSRAVGSSGTGSTWMSRSEMNPPVLPAPMTRIDSSDTDPSRRDEKKRGWFARKTRRMSIR